LGHAITVMHACVLKKIHLVISGIKVVALEALGQCSTACSVGIVHMLIVAAGVVKEGKQLHYMPIGAGLVSQHQAIGSHASPVSDTVVAPPVNLELLAQVLQQSSGIKDTQKNLSKSFPMVPQSRLSA
jgi:hypothetical protein